MFCEDVGVHLPIELKGNTQPTPLSTRMLDSLTKELTGYTDN